jgi:phage-related tail fiber protein
LCEGWVGDRCEGDRTIASLVAQASTALNSSQQIEALRNIAMFKLAAGAPKLEDTKSSSTPSATPTSTQAAKTVTVTVAAKKREKAGTGAAMAVSESVKIVLFNGLFDLLWVDGSSAIQKHLVRGIESIIHFIHAPCI